MFTRYVILSLAILSVAEPLLAQQKVSVELTMGERQLSLSWTGREGAYYEPFISTNLSGQAWKTATGCLTLSTGLSEQVTLPINESVAFYRVVEVGSNRNDLVYIPAGSFLMGDTFNEGLSHERPVHEVYISGFFIGKYKVTKALWDEVYNWSLEHGYSYENPGEAKAINHPAVMINWYDIFKWCNARSEKEGLEPCYTVGGSVYRTGEYEPDCNWDAWGYRLPTEAEWEKACRGGQQGLRLPWGNTISHANANYCGNDLETWYNESRGYHPVFYDGVRPCTNPVDYFEPNGYGLYDMVGNAWDACWDWYDAGYYTNSPAANPRGPSVGTHRIERGNGWIGNSKNSRCARRAPILPVGIKDHRGFRVCLRAD